MADMLQEGISLLKTGNLEEARAVFDRLIGKEPKNAPAHLWLGKCLALEGDLDKARKEFRSAAEHGDDIVRETAKLQLRTIMYNGFLKHHDGFIKHHNGFLSIMMDFLASRWTFYAS